MEGGGLKNREHFLFLWWENIFSCCGRRAGEEKWLYFVFSVGWEIAFSQMKDSGLPETVCFSAESFYSWAGRSSVSEQ